MTDTSKQQAQTSHPWSGALEPKADYYKRLWEREGTLYTQWDDEEMARDVLDELERQHGPMRESLPVKRYSVGYCWSPPANWKETPPKSKSTKPRRKPARKLRQPPIPHGPPKRYLEDATEEAIRSVIVDGPRNMTTSPTALELQTRQLLADTLCMLKQQELSGSWNASARMWAHDLAWAYVMQSQCRNRAIRGLVMQHVNTVLQYGWFVYAKLVLQDK